MLTSSTGFTHRYSSDGETYTGNIPTVVPRHRELPSRLEPPLDRIPRPQIVGHPVRVDRISVNRMPTAFPRSGRQAVYVMLFRDRIRDAVQVSSAAP
jgi:hypothetical protein